MPMPADKIDEGSSCPTNEEAHAATLIQANFRGVQARALFKIRAVQSVITTVTWEKTFQRKKYRQIRQEMLERAKKANIKFDRSGSVTDVLHEGSKLNS